MLMVVILPVSTIFLFNFGTFLTSRRSIFGVCNSLALNSNQSINSFDAIFALLKLFYRLSFMIPKKSQMSSIKVLFCHLDFLPMFL